MMLKFLVKLSILRAPLAKPPKPRRQIAGELGARGEADVRIRIEGKLCKPRYELPRVRLREMQHWSF